MDELKGDLDKFLDELSDEQKIVLTWLGWSLANIEQNKKDFSIEEHFFLENMNLCLTFYFMNLNGYSTDKMSKFLKEFDTFDQKISLSNEAIRLMVNKGKIYYKIFYFFFHLIPFSLEENGLPDILPRPFKIKEGKSMVKRGKV